MTIAKHYTEQDKIEVTDAQGNLIATFYSPTHAVQFLLADQKRRVRIGEELPKGRGSRYKLYQCKDIYGNLEYKSCVGHAVLSVG